MEEQIKVLVVDDQPLIRMGIGFSLVNTRYQIAGEASNVEEAVDFLKKHDDFHVVLLDLILPDGSGVDVAETIHQVRPDMKILVVSAETLPEVIVKLMEVGVDGFVSKDVGNDVLVEALDSVMSGKFYFGTDVMRTIRKAKQMADTTSALTKRELEIVRLCAQGLDVRDIANRLYISQRTVEAHKNNIFKKLGVSSTSELVTYAFQQGIMKL